MPARPEHSEQVSGSLLTRLEVELPAEPIAAPMGRQSLHDLDWRTDPELLDDVRLLVTELVANSVKHAHLQEEGWIHLRVEILPDVVRVRVDDPGTVGFDSKPEPPAGRSSGWGLVLVDQLADRWGVERPANDGTSVWFEIDRLRASASN